MYHPGRKNCHFENSIFFNLAFNHALLWSSGPGTETKYNLKDTERPQLQNRTVKIICCNNQNMLLTHLIKN